MKNLSKIIGAAVLLTSSASSAFASDVTWNFTPSNNSSINRVQNVANELLYYGNTFELNSDGLNLSVSAWANEQTDNVEEAFLDNNGGGLLSFANDGNALTTNTSDGQSVGSSSEDHWIDNFNGKIDAILFTFSEAVNLTGITFGATRGGPDVSIAAFGSAPTLGGNTWAQTFGSANAANIVYRNSFNDAGNSAVLGDGSNDSANNSVESKYWLVSAYNALIYDLKQSSASWDTNDAIKISSLTVHRTVTPPQTASAPSALALLAMSLGLLMIRRRLKQ